MRYNRGMVYRRYRRKYSSFPTWIIALLAIGIFGSILLPSVYQYQSIVVQIAIIVGIALLFISTLVFIFLQKRENDRVRALQIADIDNMTGIEFEQYVGKILQSQGYKIQFTKISGDFGADIIAHKNHDKYVFQLKRYKKSVHIEAVQQAVASMKYYSANKSGIITNSYFTKPARELADINECLLVDRDTLSTWIVEFQS